MTQMQTIAKHMVEYGHITRNTAIGMYQITRLAAVIQKMEAHGVPIVAEPIKVGKRLVDYRYAYRPDFLERLRAIKTANELLERYGWPKKAA
jgi:hypothetical protein